jgi:hypothetical protein
MGWIDKLLGKKPPARRARLAVNMDDGFSDWPAGGSSPRDRHTGDREEVLRQSLLAWQTNPLARRVVELTSQYVVGGGLRLECDHPGTQAFLRQWWEHPLNRMDVRCVEWCDELSRAGELFVLISTAADGMSYLRAVPAGQVREIRSAENDLEQEQEYVEISGGEERVWPAWDPNRDDALPYQPVMQHYAVNRPVGALRGESDLAPLLRWLSRYSAWLEDRVRLNRFRQAFLYQVKAAFSSEQERLNRQQALNAQPPSPGSILVTDEGENWSVIQPQLAAHEAGEDGLAIKRMVAAGAGIPLHFLAEPEGATRTTAEFAGGPTFRRYEQRQRYFLWMLTDLARVALARKARVNRRVRPDAEVIVRGADISTRDNAVLAASAREIVEAFLPLMERGLVDGAELRRLAYRFAGEAA